VDFVEVSYSGEEFAKNLVELQSQVNNLTTKNNILIEKNNNLID